LNSIDHPVSRTLEPYSRTFEAPACQWLGTLAYFTGLADLQASIDSPQHRAGYISHIETALGRIACIQNGCSARIDGRSGSAISLLVYCQDLRPVSSSNELVESTISLVHLIAPHQPLHIRSGEGLEALLVQFEVSFLPPRPSITALRPTQADDILSELNIYLHQVSLAPDHDSCLAETDRCLRALRDIILKGSHDPRRRAAAKALADLALSSERHLYNLMKRDLGLSPYRFFVRSRLIRVRNALIRSSSNSTGVSWHAMSHGFNHLGRFPSLYKELFGELPSETLAWRKAVMDCCDRLRDHMLESREHQR